MNAHLLDTIFSAPTLLPIIPNCDEERVKFAVLYLSHWSSLPYIFFYSFSPFLYLHCVEQKFYKTMSELKPEVETVLKTGRQIVERKQVDFPESLGKQLDAIKQLYNELGAQVYFYWIGMFLSMLIQLFVHITNRL